jgi:peptidoglycan hydrolase-like protein with peptidoglycan-binding domain
VKRLQRILVMLKLFDYRGIDGIFSSNTENAAKDFQESKHLAKD